MPWLFLASETLWAIESGMMDSCKLHIESLNGKSVFRLSKNLGSSSWRRNFLEASCACYPVTMLLASFFHCRATTYVLSIAHTSLQQAGALLQALCISVSLCEV